MSTTRITGAALALLLVAGAGSQMLAEVDLSGSWQARNHQESLERGTGPYAVDYTGLPLNEEGKSRALAYSASQFAMTERQCAYYQPTYLLIGPQGIKIWNETDPINGATIAWKISASNDRAPITIWMDGRPHPSKNAPHLIGGFTTGVWEGDTLVFYSTHMKDGYIRRNGAPVSDETTFTGYLSRHGDVLTVFGIVDDPVYLAEPFTASRSFQLDTGGIVRPVDTPCVPGYEGGANERSIAHFLPGKNPFMDELTTLYHIPAEAVVGGAETMYPEYRRKIKDKFVRPEKCTLNCGGPGRGGGAPAAAAPGPPPGR